MARSHARVLTSIWADEDFCARSRGARLMYLFLLSQPDLEHSGIIGLRLNRWADNCAGESPDSIRECLAELAEHRFVAVDWQKEELLVRSLIRRDEVWRQPNVFKAAAGSIRSSRSAWVRLVLLGELERLDLGQANKEVRTLRETLVEELRPFSPNPSPNPSGNPSGTHQPTHREAFREPLAKGTPAATGEGSSNGVAVDVAPSPFPLTPSPRAKPASAAPLWPCAVPDPEGEGDSAQSPNPDELAALVAEVREFRPEWSSRSIRRAMTDEAVRERGWERARPAMLAVAADPESQQPGRLAHDGPWWNRSATHAASPARPAWCQECDERTRLTLGDEPHRCPNCHPLNHPRSA